MMKHIKQQVAYIAIHFLLCLGFFLFVQKPVFLLWHRGYNDTVYRLTDIWDIYSNGLAIDAATAAYLTVIPLIFTWSGCLLRRFPLQKSLQVYDAIIAVLMVLATVADTSLYEFWGFKLDKMAFYYLADPKDAFASVSWSYLTIRITATIVMSYITWKVFTWSVKLLDNNCYVQTIKQRLLVCFAFILLLGIDFSIIRGWRIWPNTPARVYYSSITFFNHAALNPLYNVAYSVTKRENFAKEFRFYTDEERKKIYNGLFPNKSVGTQHVLRVKEPNVLVIVMESFGGYFLKSLDNTRPIGIQTERIMTSESLWFSNAIAGSFRTDRGIVCILSGYLGQPTTSIMRYTHKVRNLPGLAKTLKRYGYQTQMLYSGDMTFFNMADYFIAAGHDKLISQKDFPTEKRTTEWGVPDHVAFEWLFNDIQRKQLQKQKWYTTYLTISSHNPFDVPFNKYTDKIDNAFAYTDDCFGKFIDRLKKTPAWENLLIVCTADHGYPYLPSESPAFPHIPLFFTGGAVEQRGKIETIVSQTDIPATVLGQLGLPHDEFIFSRDVLAENYQYPFAMMTYNGGYQFRDSTGITVCDLNGKRIVSGADKQRERKAQAILQTLYDDIQNR
jgi:phosphoglycerol transferase MdoB-like AlkP superfamily enzyme